MKKIITFGELLIDFIPSEKGQSLKDVNSFVKHPGGAPANVAVAAKKNGSEAIFVGQVGNDSFGEFLIESLNNYNLNTNYILKTSEANTSLAFVSLDSKGERDFVFYRNPGADQLYDKSKLPLEVLKGNIFHFCSVNLDDYPVKEAHKKAINYVRDTNGFVSFDPNLRFSLWNDLEKYKRVVNEFIPMADLLKVSDDELEFITGIKDEKEAINSLFVGNVKYIILTLGSKGSKLFLKDNKEYFEESIKVDVVDTTGAGDSFIGTFLSELNKEGLKLNEDNINHILKVSNITAALTTTNKGGMGSIPSYEIVNKHLKNKH